MSPEYRNLVLLALAFASLAYVGTAFAILGAFIAGAYLSNGLVHFSYGVFGFGRMTPKRLFGEGRAAHSVWGAFNLALSAVLAYVSSAAANWPFLAAGILIAALLLPLMARKRQ